MKRFLTVLVLFLMGSVVGGLAGVLSVRGIPHCGYDCEGRASGQFFGFILMGALLFPIAGGLPFRKKQRSVRNNLLALGALSTVFFALATFFSFYLRHHFTLTLW